MNWQNVSDHLPAFNQRILLSDGVDFQCGYRVDKLNYKYQVPQHGFEIWNHRHPPFVIKYWLDLTDENIQWISIEDRNPEENKRVVVREYIDLYYLPSTELNYECGAYFGEKESGWSDWVCDTTDLFDPDHWAEVILPK